jgi:hypothetical protein
MSGIGVLETPSEEYKRPCTIISENKMIRFSNVLRKTACDSFLIETRCNPIQKRRKHPSLAKTFPDNNASSASLM